MNPNPEWGRAYTVQPVASPLDEQRWADRGGGFLAGLALGMILHAWLHRGGK